MRENSARPRWHVAELAFSPLALALLLLGPGRANFNGDVGMKIVALIVRWLLGVVFLVFGLNALLQFLKGPIPGADDPWAGNRKYFALPSAAQSRRHRGRDDRGGVLVCVVLRLSPILFWDLYRKGFVYVVTATRCIFARQGLAPLGRSKSTQEPIHETPNHERGGFRDSGARTCAVSFSPRPRPRRAIQNGYLALGS